MHTVFYLDLEIHFPDIQEGVIDTLSRTFQMIYWRFLLNELLKQGNTTSCCMKQFSEQKSAPDVTL